MIESSIIEIKDAVGFSVLSSEKETFRDFSLLENELIKTAENRELFEAFQGLRFEEL